MIHESTMEETGQMDMSLLKKCLATEIRTVLMLSFTERRDAHLDMMPPTTSMDVQV